MTQDLPAYFTRATDGLPHERLRLRRTDSRVDTVEFIVVIGLRMLRADTF